MVKAYLRYSLQAQIGALSQNYGIIHEGQCYSACGQYVLIVNLKSQETRSFIDKNCEIRSLSVFGNLLAAGYADGEIVIFSISDGLVISRLMGHSSEITALKFVGETSLISGSADTSLVQWDLVEQNIQLRMTGHTNAITGLEVIYLEETTGHQRQLILSSSRDGLVKVWDLELESSVQTISSAHSEVAAMTYYDSTIVIASNQDELIFKGIAIENGAVIITEQGVFKRNSFARTIQITYYQDKLFILTNEKKIEIYRLKAKKNPLIGDCYTLQTVIAYSQKVNSFHVQQNKYLKITCFLQNNVIDVRLYSKDNVEVESDHIISYGTVRRMELSTYDQRLVLINGKNSAVHDVPTNQKIGEYEHTHELTSLAILPKNKYYLIGDNIGQIHLIDLSSSQILNSLKAHDHAVNNIAVCEKSAAYDGLVIMTTEAEKKINFLGLFLNKKQLELQIVSSITVKESIRSASFTPNGEMYAVALYNNNIQLYYANTHKLFLELYGHSLPILTFGITSDNTLLISGGVDKSIKIWALDFGNCKKTIKGQAEISHIRPINDTHYFVSASKDNIVRLWDGDTHQLVQQFSDALSPISSIVMGCIGDLFYTASKEGIVRKYIQTKEQIFVHEEEDRRVADQLLEEIQTQHKAQPFHQGDQVGKDLAIQQIGKVKLQEAEDLMNLLEEIKKRREKEEQQEDIDEYQFNGEDPTLCLFRQLESCDLSMLKFLHSQHQLTLLAEMQQPIALKLYPAVCQNLLTWIYTKQDGFGLDSHETLLSVLSITGKLKNHFKLQKKQVGFNLEAIDLLLEQLTKKDEEDFELEF